MNLKLIGQDVIASVLKMPRAIELMREAYAELSAGSVDSPLRTALVNEVGTVLYKPAYSKAAEILCVKVISVFPGNAEKGLPVIPGVIVVNSAETGMPVAILEAGYLTSLRTGAATGLATDLFAKKEAKVAALFGTGGQSRHQLEAMLCARDFETVYVFSRNAENAERFCRENADIARGCQLVPNAERTVLKLCDVITTATTSAVALFEWDEVADDVHVNAIGALGPMRTELTAETLLQSAVVVDDREACLREAGEICLMRQAGLVGDDYYPAEIGELLDGPDLQGVPTVFRSVGNAAQDLLCSAEILRITEAQNLGVIAQF
mgnify:CR=1 FL=1